jgi:hypothetical protein
MEGAQLVAEVLAAAGNYGEIFLRTTGKPSGQRSCLRFDRLCGEAGHRARLGGAISWPSQGDRHQARAPVTAVRLETIT